MAGFGDTFETRILNSVLRAVAWTAVPGVTASLHTADPGDTGASEVTGGSYARQAITFAAPAVSGTANQCTSSAAVNFTSMPAVTITHYGLWTTDVTPVFIGGGPLNASKTLNAGDTYTLSTATLSLD